MAEPRRTAIEAIRKTRGMRRSQLATQIGKSYKHIWGLERGNHPAAQETLQNIADALAVPLSAVMVPAEDRGVA
jgi:transcriptional regulator with XRE-family HTH domain